MQFGGIFAHVGSNDVVRHHFLQQVKPEERDLREDLSLARNACAQHVIERRDAIGGHHQQRVAHRVEIAHFSPPKQGCVAKVGNEQCGHGRGPCFRQTESPIVRRWALFVNLAAQAKTLSNCRTSRDADRLKDNRQRALGGFSSHQPPPRNRVTQRCDGHHRLNFPYGRNFDCQHGSESE